MSAGDQGEAGYSVSAISWSIVVQEELASLKSEILLEGGEGVALRATPAVVTEIQ